MKTTVRFLVLTAVLATAVAQRFSFGNETNPSGKASVEDAAVEVAATEQVRHVSLDVGVEGVPLGSELVQEAAAVGGGVRVVGRRGAHDDRRDQVRDGDLGLVGVEVSGLPLADEGEDIPDGVGDVQVVGKRLDAGLTEGSELCDAIRIERVHG